MAIEMEQRKDQRAPVEAKLSSVFEDLAAPTGGRGELAKAHASNAYALSDKQATGPENRVGTEIEQLQKRAAELIKAKREQQPGALPGEIDKMEKEMAAQIDQISKLDPAIRRFAIKGATAEWSAQTEQTNKDSEAFRQAVLRGIGTIK